MPPPPDPYRSAWWAFDPRQSLRARAALLVGGGMLACVVLLAWITGALYRRTLENQTGAQLATLAAQLGDKLDRAVYERYRTLTFAATLPLLRDPAANPAERRRVLNALQDAQPEFAWIGVTDPAGRIAAATGGLFEENDAALRPWFRGARETPFAGPLHEIPELVRAEAPLPGSAPSHESSPRFLDLAVPVADSHGQFAGVLAAHLRWSWTREVLLSVVPESLAREHIGATVYAGGDVLLDSGASGWTLPPDPPAVPEQRRARGSLLENPGDTTFLTGYARSPGFREYRGFGWLTIVRQPAAHAFAAVDSLRRAILAWGFALTLAAATLAWILAGRHARRLRSARAAALRIHEGDILTVLPRPPGDSELARMCTALDTLVEDLRARQPSTATPPRSSDPRANVT